MHRPEDPMRPWEVYAAIKFTGLPVNLVASWLGVSRRTVNRWFKGYTTPSGDVAKALRAIQRDPKYIQRSERIAEKASERAKREVLDEWGL